MTCPHTLQGLRVASWVVRAQLGIAACALCAGCLSGPTVTVTPANQAQVGMCERNANWHNVGLVTGALLGGAGAGLGTAATLTTNENTQKTEAAVGIGIGVAAVGVTVLTAITGQEYASQQCAALTGPLPAP
jgi:hypothetical protein